MNTRLIIGIIILILCCVLAFLIPKFGLGNNDCEGGVCPPPTERRNTMLDWLANLAWYWIAAGIGVIAYLLWYFVGE
jgi:hypothetical protein